MQHASQYKPRVATPTRGGMSINHSTQPASALRPSPECPVCHGKHGTEYQREDGGWVVKHCIRCASRQKTADLQAQYPLGESLVKATLTFTPMAGEEKALAQARRYAEQPRGWFVVQGGSGNGKSLMLAGIYHAIAGRGYNALYLTAATIARLYHVAIDPASSVSLYALQSLLTGVNLLCIDELDKVDWTKSFVHNEFFDMFNRRYERLAWTAIAYNDDSAIPVAMYSRLADGRWGDGSGNGITRNTAEDVRPYLPSLWTDPRTGESIA